MNETDFLNELAGEIEKQGYDRATAERYAALIGDTPVNDEAGNIIVMDGDRLIGTLKPLLIFQGE